MPFPPLYSEHRENVSFYLKYYFSSSYQGYKHNIYIFFKVIEIQLSETSNFSSSHIFHVIFRVYLPVSAC